MDISIIESYESVNNNMLKNKIKLSTIIGTKVVIRMISIKNNVQNKVIT